MGSNRFSDGFLLGLLVGGAAVFLLGTKKGNKILHALTEEGLDGLTDLLETMEEKEVVPRAIKKAEKVVDDVSSVVEEKVEEKFDGSSKSNGASHDSSSRKRFFRKAK